MRLAIRTILVIVIGIVVSVAMYFPLNSTYGQFMGPNGPNPNFMSLISAWRALGGAARPLTSETMGRAGGGGPPFAASGGTEARPYPWGLVWQ